MNGPNLFDNQENKPKFVHDRVLGKGAFGTVFLVKQKGTNQVYALKETFENPNYKNREAQIIGSLRHQIIVKVFQIFHTHRKDGKYLNILMEYLPQSLHDVITQHRVQKQCMPEKEISYYMFQLARACAYLARRNICHRDIKPANILVDSRTKKIRLCDFGSAKVLTHGEWNKHYICSRHYRAPELLCESNFYSTTVDIWSIGCILAEMYLCKPLFGGTSSKHQLQLIANILGPVPPRYPKKCQGCLPLKTKQWMQVLSQNNYKCGETGQGASLHAGSYINQMLCYDPKNRCDLMEILFHPFNIEMIHLSTSMKNTNTNKVMQDRYSLTNCSENSQNVEKVTKPNKDTTNCLSKKYQGFETIVWSDEEIPYLEKFAKKFDLATHFDERLP